MRLLKKRVHAIISGSMAKMMSVSAGLAPIRMMKGMTILIPAMKNSSGQ